MNIIRETKLQGIINDFKDFKQQFANVIPVSHEHWVLLKSESNFTPL